MDARTKKLDAFYSPRNSASTTQKQLGVDGYPQTRSPQLNYKKLQPEPKIECRIEKGKREIEQEKLLVSDYERYRR